MTFPSTRAAHTAGSWRREGMLRIQARVTRAGSAGTGELGKREAEQTKQR